MRPMTSHGRPVSGTEFRSNWIALFLSLSAGVLLVGAFASVAVSEMKLRSTDALTDLAKRYSELVEEAISQQHATANINKGTLRLKEGLPYEVQLAQAAQPDDLALQERILRTFQNQFSLADLKSKGVVTLTVKRSDIGSDEYLVVVRASKSADVPFSVLDAAKMTGAFAKAHPHRVALVSSSGKILAHSLRTMVGADISKEASLKDAVKTVMGTGKVVDTGIRNAAGSDELEYVVLKAATPGLAILVERPVLGTPLSLSGVMRGKKSFFGLLAAAVMTFGAALVMTARRSRSQVNRNIASMSVPQYPSQVNPQQMLARATQALPKAQELRVHEQRRAADAQVAIVQKTSKRDFVAELQKAATSNSSENEVERLMTQLASELTESPILFFRYQGSTNNLHFSGHANLGEPPQEVTFPIYVRPDIEAQVLTLANQGKAAALTNYGPVSSLMLQGLGTSHFEAWAVTTGQEMSLNGAELIGLLIVKHAGSRSAEMRPVLARLLKVGANSIYGLRNKISRSNINRESPSQYPNNF
jgi:hypothetical protein